MILEKAQNLTLSHFESSEFYDQAFLPLTRKHQGRRSPLGSINFFRYFKNAISFSSFAFYLGIFRIGLGFLLICWRRCLLFIAEAKICLG